MKKSYTPTLVIFIVAALLIIGYVVLNNIYPPTTSQNNATSPVNNAVASKTSSSATDALYASMLTATSTATQSIDITGCKPTPASALVADHSSLLLVNRDNVSHTVFLNPITTVFVATSSSKSIKIDIPSGSAYLYGCDGKAVAVLKIK